MRVPDRSPYTFSYLYLLHELIPSPTNTAINNNLVLIVYLMV